MNFEKRNLNQELNQFPNETSVSEELEKKVLASFKAEASVTTRSPKRKRVFMKLMPYLAMVALMLILIPLGINEFNKHHITVSGVDISKIETEASKKVGHQVTIPIFSNYPLLGVEVIPEPNNHSSLDMWYGKTKEEKASQKQMDFMKNQQHWDILYGVYQGTNILHLTFRTGNTTMGNDQGTKTKTINGKKVEYLVFEQNGHKSMSAIVNVNQGSYVFEFFLDDHITEDDAFNMVSQFLEDL